MDSIFIVWYDDYSEGNQLRAVFSTKEKAQKWIDRTCDELYLGEPLYERDSFSIDWHYIDDEDYD